MALKCCCYRQSLRKNKQTNKQFFFCTERRRPTHHWRLQTVQENLDSRIKAHRNQHRRRRGDNEISNRKGPLSTLRVYECQHCVCKRMSTLCVQECQHCVCKNVNTACVQGCLHCVFTTVSKLRVYKNVKTVDKCENCVFTSVNIVCARI